MRPATLKETRHTHARTHAIPTNDVTNDTSSPHRSTGRGEALCATKNAFPDRYIGPLFKNKLHSVPCTDLPQKWKRNTRVSGAAHAPSLSTRVRKQHSLVGVPLSAKHWNGHKQSGGDRQSGTRAFCWRTNSSRNMARLSCSAAGKICVTWRRKIRQEHDSHHSSAAKTHHIFSLSTAFSFIFDIYMYALQALDVWRSGRASLDAISYPPS